MTFRGKPTSVEPDGLCWCGAEAQIVTWSEEDAVRNCSADVFHNPGVRPVYVKVELAEGRAYTYESIEDPPLEVGEWVRLPGNEVHAEIFAGKVIRLLDGPDPRYDGPYKAVLGRVL